MIQHDIIVLDLRSVMYVQHRNDRLSLRSFIVDSCMAFVRKLHRVVVLIMELLCEVELFR